MHSRHDRPRIGITADPSYDIAEYEAAVRQAGGEPVRWMPDVARLAADLREIDGIILSGGDDVDPARYGKPVDAHAELATSQRDAYELALARAAFDAGLPTLAICRGLQIANVAFGGSLYQHVPDIFGEDVPHRIDDGGTTYRGLIEKHRVEVTPGSRLESIAGAALVTGSRHHQSVDRVAPSLRVVARTPDGVVEALEAPGATSFWLGVQWHPESTVSLDAGASAALFRALKDSCGVSCERNAL